MLDQIIKTLESLPKSAYVWILLDSATTLIWIAIALAIQTKDDYYLDGEIIHYHEEQKALNKRRKRFENQNRKQDKDI